MSKQKDLQARTRRFRYCITKSQSVLNILDFLKSLGYSHAIITTLKKTPDGIQKNGIWARVRDSLAEGDILTITLIENQTSEQILPVSLPLCILYEDEDLMIINKPSGMPIHPSQGNYDNTLANSLAFHFRQKREAFVYRCINRLDRDTTGLLIIAKHAYSASLLSSMAANRELHREYLAIVCGEIEPAGMVEAPIGRAEGSTIEREVNLLHGEYAKTTWKRLCQKKGYALVSLVLETGRTHQIRVHMSYIGHPLPGDFLYHPKDTTMARQALHAHKLRFLHPITGIPMEFVSELPSDMQWILTL